MTDHEIINMLRKDIRAKNKLIHSLQKENKNLLFQNAQMKFELGLNKEMKELISDLREAMNSKDFIQKQQDVIFELNQIIKENLW